MWHLLNGYEGSLLLADRPSIESSNFTPADQSIKPLAMFRGFPSRISRTLECPLSALSGYDSSCGDCAFSGVKQTSRRITGMCAYDAVDAAHPTAKLVSTPLRKRARWTQSELSRRARWKFPVGALFLPVHQDVEFVGAFLAIGDSFTFTHPVKPHDRCSLDNTNLEILLGKRQKFRFPMGSSGDEGRLVLDPAIGMAVAELRSAERVERFGVGRYLGGAEYLDALRHGIFIR